MLIIAEIIVYSNEIKSGVKKYSLKNSLSSGWKFVLYSTLVLKSCITVVMLPLLVKNVIIQEHIRPVKKDNSRKEILNTLDAKKFIDSNISKVIKAVTNFFI